MISKLVFIHLMCLAILSSSLKVFFLPLWKISIVFYDYRTIVVPQGLAKYGISTTILLRLSQQKTKNITGIFCICVFTYLLVPLLVTIDRSCLRPFQNSSICICWGFCLLVFILSYFIYLFFFVQVTFYILLLKNLSISRHKWFSLAKADCESWLKYVIIVTKYFVFHIKI